MTSERASLVPDETRALVGQLVGEPVSAEVTLRDVHRYAHAVDDLNPLYFDDAYAKAQGYRGLVAPPTWLLYGLAPSQPLSEMRHDGLFRNNGPRVRLNVKRVMFGGIDWDFLASVCVGDVVTAETRLKSLEEKEGGSGPFVLQTNETTYTNQDGQVVARARQVGIAR